MVWDVPVLIGGPAHGQVVGADLTQRRVVLALDPTEPDLDAPLTYTARKAGVTGGAVGVRYLAHESLDGPQALAELWDWMINRLRADG